MKTKKMLGVVFLIAGVLLIIYGYDRVNSFGSQLSGAFGEKDLVGIGSMVAGAVLAIYGFLSVKK